MAKLHELAARRDGFGLDPEVRRRRDSGEVHRVRAPLGHEAILFSRYDDVRAVHDDAERLRLADPLEYKHRAPIHGPRSLPLAW
ncbi:hypothetical protein [Amycolatopsis minnesotensis]